jgi:hypothetical protein
MALKKSDLYRSLWQSCDELRGGMDASQYKDYILTLLFVKYVTDKAKSDPNSLIEVPKGVGDINVDVVYKDIKNLHIGVYPPIGRVRVAAPRRLDEEHVRLAVIQRLAWIKRQRRQLQDAARQSAREMVTGESHYVWGMRYRLKIVERPGRPHIELDGGRLLLYVPENTNTSARLSCCGTGNAGSCASRSPHSSRNGSPPSAGRCRAGASSA